MENLEEQLKEKEEQLFKIQQDINVIRSNYNIQKELNKIILNNLEDNILNDVVFRDIEGIEGMNILMIYFKLNGKPYQIEAKINKFESSANIIQEILSKQMLGQLTQLLKK
jgi:ribosome-binding factor A